MYNRKNTQDFIIEAQEIHGNKYDYSKVNYKNARVKVCIICPSHGEFWQFPFNHLRGQGCPKCAGRIKKTTKDFIEDARKIYGDKYDYTNVEYVNNKTPVCIICTEHGKFWQKPNYHLMGHGCPKCGKKQSVLSKTSSTEAFIKKAEQTHGKKYCYSKVKYINSRTRVCIICPEHGEFWQSPNSHLHGKGCPQCAKLKLGQTRRMTTEEFIDRAKRVHGNIYDYSKVKYLNNHTKVCIICPEHGEFWQIPSDHLKGCGCAKCRIDALSATRRSTTEIWIRNAKNIHGNKYGYSISHYVDSHTPIQIICPTHGAFLQLPSVHLQGHGCPKCAIENKSNLKKLDIKQFVKQAKLVHKNKYDYSKVKYVNSRTKVCIICPEHGEFWQKPNNHLMGQGCPKCGKKQCAMSQASTTDAFITKARQIHNDKYNYANTKYINNRTKVCIICSKHGEFWQYPKSHLCGCGCPKCAHIESAPELEIVKYLSSLIGKENIILRDRKLLHGKELDIYIPKYNTAIEFDGLYWHTDARKGKYYHLNKTEECEKQGINLIHIFEDEWVNKKEIILSMINQILRINCNIVPIWKTELIKIDKKTAMNFIEKNHLFGKTSSSINLCLKYNNDIVSLISFKILNKTKKYYLLSRYCNKINTFVPYSEKVMFDYFIKKYRPQKVIVQIDRRWNNSNMYKELRFKHYKTTNPTYYYVMGDKRRQKKNIANKTINLNKIYDCGKYYFMWDNK